MSGDALYEAYHDAEWGVPEYDSRALWEKLVLDGFQAGLAWITILRKREAFRAAFDNFDPEKVAAYGEADRARLMADAGIVRSNAKIDAAIGGARIYLAMRDRGEDFSEFCWTFVEGKPVQNAWTDRGQVPAQTPLAVEVSKALKAEGFKFVGPVIVYAWMQAVGMVNDQLLPARAGEGAGGLTWRAAPPCCWRRPSSAGRSAASTRRAAGRGPGRSAPPR
jgi:DNA-3-methyladenine glycosylase I